MRTYFDTSCLVKLYIPESGSSRVVERVVADGKALLFTPLHETELRNALALKAFRNEISREQLGAVLLKIDHDILRGRLNRPRIDWTETYSRANQMSLLFTIENGCRTLDILHVALASVLSCQLFITNDDRQRVLAESAGMNTDW